MIYSDTRVAEIETILINNSDTPQFEDAWLPIGELPFNEAVVPEDWLGVKEMLREPNDTHLGRIVLFTVKEMAKYDELFIMSIWSQYLINDMIEIAPSLRKKGGVADQAVDFDALVDAEFDRSLVREYVEKWYIYLGHDTILPIGDEQIGMIYLTFMHWFLANDKNRGREELVEDLNTGIESAIDMKQRVDRTVQKEIDDYVYALVDILICIMHISVVDGVHINDMIMESVYPPKILPQ